MEHPETPRVGREHFQTSSGEISSTSALDLTGTPAGIGSSRPPSPANLTPREGSSSRRRLSWGRMEQDRPDVWRDPLRLNLTDINYPPRSVSQTTSASNDDPFESDTPKEEDALTRIPQPYFTQRGAENAPRTYSQASLISSIRSKSTTSADYGEFDIDDDEARLTSFASGTAGHDRSAMSLSVSHLDPSMTSGVDVERTPKNRLSKRQSKRYSTTPSPASRLRSVSRNLRRVSLRVVNLAGVGLEEKARGIRLPDDDDDGAKVKGKDTQRTAGGEDDDEEQELPDLAARLPIRGTTLGFLGPNSRIRLAMFQFLTYPYVHYSAFKARSTPLTFARLSGREFGSLFKPTDHASAHSNNASEIYSSQMDRTYYSHPHRLQRHCTHHSGGSFSYSSIFRLGFKLYSTCASERLFS